MGDLDKVRSALSTGGVVALARGVARRAVLRAVELAKRPLHPRVDGAEACHAAFARFAAAVNALEKPRLLEIGSRARSGNVYTDRFPGADYVGFDVVAGENVHVVGDAHELSRYFPAGHFDAVFAVSVFEHLAMPWKVVLEMNAVLRTGGMACVFTHPTYPPHDRPWDFWRFTREAFDVLFSRPMGFQLVEAAEGLRCAVVPLANEPPLVGLWREPAHLGVTAWARKVGAPDPRARWDLAARDVVPTTYPR